MIITQKKPFEEVLAMLGDAKKVLVTGCAECATVCKTGGVEEVEEMKKLLTENGLEVIIVRGIRHLLFLLFLVIRFDFWTGCLPLGGARETRAPGKTKERSPKRTALMVMDYLTLGSPASSSICTVSETNWLTASCTSCLCAMQ